MRKLAVTENITHDGVIDASERWFVPSGEEDVDQSDLNEALREQAAAADAVLLGRVTFEEMRGFWPLQTNDKASRGRGARLFEDATNVGKLRIVDCRPFRSGIVLRRYRTNG